MSMHAYMKFLRGKLLCSHWGADSEIFNSNCFTQCNYINKRTSRQHEGHNCLLHLKNYHLLTTP